MCAPWQYVARWLQAACIKYDSACNSCQALLLLLFHVQLSACVWFDMHAASMMLGSCRDPGSQQQERRVAW
jgi:hypothetical protein